jgi:hypothetical protein
MSFYRFALGKGTLQYEKIRLPGKSHNLFAKTGVPGVNKALTIRALHPVSETVAGMLDRLRMKLEKFKGHPVWLENTELLDVHDLAGHIDPLPVSSLKILKKVFQALRPHQPEGGSFLENRGVPGSKKEMNQVRCVIRVEMGNKDLPDSVVMDAHAGKLTECARPRVKQNRSAARVKDQRGRSPLCQGNSRSRSNDNHVHRGKSQQIRKDLNFSFEFIPRCKQRGIQI